MRNETSPLFRMESIMNTFALDRLWSVGRRPLCGSKAARSIALLSVLALVAVAVNLTIIVVASQ